MTGCKRRWPKFFDWSVEDGQQRCRWVCCWIGRRHRGGYEISQRQTTRRCCGNVAEICCRIVVVRWTGSQRGTPQVGIGGRPVAVGGSFEAVGSPRWRPTATRCIRSCNQWDSTDVDLLVDDNWWTAAVNSCAELSIILLCYIPHFSCLFKSLR